MDSVTFNIWSTALTKLKDLSLQHCGVLIEDFNAFLSCMINLTSLRLITIDCFSPEEEEDVYYSDSSSEGEASSILDTLPSLSNLLSLTTDYLVDAVISECTQLHHLSLSSSLNCQYISTITNLLQLKVVHEATNLHYLANLTQLQKLSLNHQQKHVIRDFPYLPNLTCLSAPMARNGSFLKRIPNLRILKMRYSTAPKNVDEWPPHENIQIICSSHGTVDYTEEYKIKYPKLQSCLLFGL